MTELPLKDELVIVEFSPLLHLLGTHKIHSNIPQAHSNPIFFHP